MDKIISFGVFYYLKKGELYNVGLVNKIFAKECKEYIFSHVEVPHKFYKKGMKHISDFISGEELDENIKSLYTVKNYTDIAKFTKLESLGMFYNQRGKLSIPSGLKKLNIIFYGTHLELPDSLEQLIIHYGLNTVNNIYPKNIKCIKITSIPHNSDIVLKIPDSVEIVEYPTFYGKLITFPKNLREVILPVNHLCGSFPESIEVIKNLHVTKDIYQQFAKLRNVRHLSIMRADVDLIILPENLKEICFLENIKNININFPPIIESIDFSYVNYNKFMSFPSTVKKLLLPTNYNHQIMLHDGIEILKLPLSYSYTVYLPKTIKNLKYFSNIHKIIYPEDTSNLKVCVFSRGYKVLSLPNTLKSLKLKDFNKCPEIPQNVQNLKLYCISGNVYLSGKNIENLIIRIINNANIILPVSLQKLTIDNCFVPHFHLKFPDGLETIILNYDSLRCITNIPRNLKTLIINLDYIEINYVQNIKDLLKKFNLNYYLNSNADCGRMVIIRIINQ